MQHRSIARIATATLLGGASLLSLSTAAQAQSVLFSTSSELSSGATLDTGREVSIVGGTVQVKLSGGAVASFVDSAQFSLRDDGSVDLRSGSVTVVGAGGATAAVHLPDGVRGTVAGGSAATFTATPGGARGSTTAGSVSVVSNGVTRTFAAGQFWTASGDRAPGRVVAGLAAAVPRGDGPVRAMAEGGVAAAAENGLPVALGEALAGVGASGDVVAAARRIEAYDADPTIAAFPTGDYALLVQYAAQANGLFGAGGTAFRGAGADIVRAYFEYLAAGGAGASFRTAYAQVLLNYLDLLRSGVLPSTFRGATQAQLSAYLAFIGRTDGFGGLSAANRQLLDAYLAFLSSGGTADAFGTSVVNLTTSFLNFVRGGGNPAGFTQVSATVVAQYLAIVNSGALRTNLTAQNQALLAAYLANNGVGFTTTYATGLAAFVAYLDAGGLPSGYAALPAATVRQYLETLETTGLFDSILGTQSAFLRSYLAFLRTGGTPDQFNALPINVARVNASDLSIYVDYLLAGGAPSAYATLTQAQIRAALDQLTATGQFAALLGQNAAFLGEYYAYIRTGADADTFAGLPSVDVNAYATALTAFAAYLRAGNLPSGYAALTAQQVRSYLTALQVGGRLALLGDNQMLLADYLAYIRTGGAPDAFAGLPIVTYTGYATALSAYFAYLDAGGLPSGYTVLTQAQVRQYLDVLRANGQFTLLGANAGFYTDYLAFIAGGGSVDAFAGLPIVTFQSYATALSAYFAYLDAGGLPSGYTALTQAQIRQYLDALSANAQLTALLGANAAFFTAYRTYLAGGGAVDAFGGLPIVTYQSYASALTAYYAFLIGGGTPSAYTALSQAQISQYLDALSAAGQVTALLGSNAAFFSQYLAFLETGGSANDYPGLPSSTYGQYAAALSAYFAYLNAGGLPSGYTQLTAAQIRDYLSVLQSNNQLAALLGADATFFADYLTFVSGGGSPDAFTGLPILAYQNYASALAAYYSFLAGGGLPANYTALTQAQIRAYLDALTAANQITALLGANATFFASYYSYLAGGGSANDFPGLPSTTYAQYGSALTAFVAYLRGNGLPASYSALTSTQLREYLAVLQANGQLGLVGSAADQQLLTAYAAFLAGGGVPNQFQGLPAFVTYEAALRTYYAFLQGGGRPSAYAALTQAQIVAYIQALDAAGLVAAKLTAAEAAFLRDYAAYVAAGNDADQFAGLPGAGIQPLPAPGYSYAGGFTASANANYRTVSAGATRNNINNGVQIVVGGDGKVTQLASSVRVGTATVTDVAGNADAVVGRWTGDGRTFFVGNPTSTFSGAQSLHYFATSPITATKPATGTVNFAMLAATQPTYESGFGAAGLFDATMALNFGTNRLGIEGTIAMPAAGGGRDSYAIASSGGVAAPSIDLFTWQLNNLLFRAAMTGAGRGCGGTCELEVQGSFGGATVNTLGIAYRSLGTSVADSILGAAIFTGDAAPPPTGGGLTQTPYPYVAGLPTNLVRVRAAYPSQNTVALTTYGGSPIAQSNDGGLDRVGLTPPGSQDITRGSARNADVAGDARVVIGRWLDGGYTRGTTANTLSATQSLHYAATAPVAFTIPYLGRVDYTLLAATQPTFAGGQAGAGLFDARMAVLFASSAKVALEGTIRMPEASGTVTYAFTTPGGIANASQAAAVGDLSSGGFAVTAGLTGTGVACQSATTCTLRFEGGFGGNDPLRIGGVYYTTAANGIAGTTSITGAAAFGGAWVGDAQTVSTVTNRNVNAIAPLAVNALNVNQGTYDVDGAGRVVGLTNFNGLYDRLGTAQIAESGSAVGGLIGWTRWANGTLDVRRNGPGSVVLNANQGYQILHGAPASALPTSGVVNYTLAGGTRPTDFAGTRAPGELVSGQAAVAFGATTRVAFDLVARLGGADYNLFTNGKIAGVATSEVTVATGGIINQVIGAGGNVTSTGGDCPATQCRAIWQGFLAGAGGTALGLNYQVQNTSTQARFGGIAAFEKGATQGGGGGTGFSGTLSGQTTYAYAGSSLVDQGITTATYADGKIASYQSFLFSKQQSAGVTQESGRLADTIGWARWTGDTAGPLTNQGPNAGVHVMSGSPTAVSTLPTSGTVQYAMVGGTKPTLAGGAVAPGTITGTLGVAFGGTPRVGIDITAEVGGYGWRVQTPGGSANPSQSQMTVGAQGTFSQTFTKQVGVTPTTAASCATACSGTIGGQFYGPGGSHVGLAFNMMDSGPAGLAQASGIAVFAKQP